MINNPAAHRNRPDTQGYREVQFLGVPKKAVQSNAWETSGKIVEIVSVF